MNRFSAFMMMPGMMCMMRTMSVSMYIHESGRQRRPSLT